MLSITLIALLMFPLLLVVSGLYDLTTMTIPNWINGLLCVSFPLLGLFVGLDGATLLNHLGAGAAMLVLGFVLFGFGWIGGGDAKLIAAIGIWCGFEMLLTFLLVASFFGGILTLLILLYRFCPVPIVIGKLNWLVRLHDQKEGVPYGIALAAAGLFVYQELAIYPKLAVSILG